MDVIPRVVRQLPLRVHPPHHVRRVDVLLHHVLRLHRQVALDVQVVPGHVRLRPPVLLRPMPAAHQEPRRLLRILRKPPLRPVRPARVAVDPEGHVQPLLSGPLDHPLALRVLDDPVAVVQVGRVEEPLEAEAVLRHEVHVLSRVQVLLLLPRQRAVRIIEPLHPVAAPPIPVKPVQEGRIRCPAHRPRDQLRMRRRKVLQCPLAIAAQHPRLVPAHTPDERPARPRHHHRHLPPADGQRNHLHPLGKPQVRQELPHDGRRLLASLAAKPRHADALPPGLIPAQRPAHAPKRPQRLPRGQVLRPRNLPRPLTPGPPGRQQYRQANPTRQAVVHQYLPNSRITNNPAIISAPPAPVKRESRRASRVGRGLVPRPALSPAPPHRTTSALPNAPAPSGYDGRPRPSPPWRPRRLLSTTTAPSGRGGNSLPPGGGCRCGPPYRLAAPFPSSPPLPPPPPPPKAPSAPEGDSARSEAG